MAAPEDAVQDAVEDAVDMAQPAPAPAPNPDAQTTVNDFLDYTDFFPSDLVRSLTLIGHLDSTYRDAVQHVHDLTSLYGQLPALPEQERPDPVLLRKQIAQHLQKAINQREYAYTEASRLYEVTVRHCQRSSIIKRKLHAQPEPPSRDPTPPPISPSAHKTYVRPSYERPAHLRLTFDAARHAATTARERDRRRPGQLPSRRPRPRSASDDDDDPDSDTRSNIDLAVPTRKLKQNRDRHAARPRAQGVLGTNVHSSIAGISTSNALAQLAPPPPDARPGSKWAPWLKLTEYEMAVLRKQMKKNAVWTPSLTMVNRELEKKHRTKADYDREKARCEEAGEEMLDEEPDSLQHLVTASGLGQLASSGPAPERADPARDDPREDPGTISIRLKPTGSKEGRKLDRLSQRQQAMRDAIELQEVTQGLTQAAEGLKEFTFPPPAAAAAATPASQKKKSDPRPASTSNKRKRDVSPPPATENPSETPRAASVATEDSESRQPEPKRPRLQSQLSALASNVLTSPATSRTPASPLSTPRDTPASAELSPIANTPVPIPESKRHASEGITVQVPLAPAGPSTPKVTKTTPKEPSEPPTPTAVASDAMQSAATPTAPPPTQPATTAASSRPRRESVAPKAVSPPAQPLKTSKASTPVPESIPDATGPATRPRSARGHVPTPKAQSEEPKPNEIGRITRESCRHSIFSQSALVGPTRQSMRKKPPPKGEVTAAEDGQKTVTNVKRAQGSKNKKKKKTEEDSEAADDIDPDEEKYCICDDVSYGPMISCDNNVSINTYPLSHMLT